MLSLRFDRRLVIEGDGLSLVQDLQLEMWNSRLDSNHLSPVLVVIVQEELALQGFSIR